MIAHNLRYSLSALLLSLALLPIQLPAAIVQTGNVEPHVDLWNSSIVGYIGTTSDGSVLINEGSVLASRLAYVGDSSGKAGMATVTGAGSKWTSTGSIIVGDSGNGSLTIEAGGQVSNASGDIGRRAGSISTATVTGVGSKWTNSRDLSIGLEGGSGTLTVADGGEVEASELYASLSDLLGNGTITATKGGVLDVDLLFDATHGTQKSYPFGSGGSLNVNWSGGTLGVGYKENGSLTVAEGFNLVSGYYGYLGFLSGSSGMATITGAGSKWTTTGALYVGHSGNGSLTIEAGGQVSNGNTYLGGRLGSTGTATVTGAGSQWSVYDLYVGAGPGGSNPGDGILKIEAGGQVSSRSGVVRGSSYLSASNPTAVTVTGEGSKWTNSDSLSFSGGRLTIDDGGQVSNGHGYLGYSSGRTATATVIGAGSQWLNHGYLYVGGNGGNGTLIVGAGGRIVSGAAEVGYNGSTVTNPASGTATVSGAGANWTASGKFTVYQGTLSIEAGGQVSSTTGDLFPLGAATVRDAGSKWTNLTALYVGGMRGSGGSKLTVADGGEVETAELYASPSDLFGDGTITATRGAVLDADLHFDATHTLQQSFAFGSGGTLTVNWNGGALGAGYRQSGSLTVSDGVNISSSIGYLGFKSGSIGTALVTGAGSQWTNSGELWVGRSGNGILAIEAGGQVRNTTGRLNQDSAATVTGPDSKWTNSSDLFVSGNGNLKIAAGGQVNNATGYLGAMNYGNFAPNSMSTATVTGTGSKWTNRGELFVGGYNDGILGLTTYSEGTLTITGGGLVSVRGRLSIDYDLDGDSFINMATGGMLALWGDADDSLSQFLGLVSGTDPIRFWDDSLSDWSPLTSAAYGDDYTLSYLAEGDLSGYTLLTVGRAGDFDNNGDVDGGDFLTWQRGGSPAADLAAWQDVFGTPATANTGAVPEPTTWLLAAGCCLYGLFRRRRR